MNKNILFVLPLSWVLASCVSLPVCEPYTGPTPPCTGNPQAPQVSLNTITLNATPHCVRATAGATIVFRLVPPADNKKDSVEISPKVSGNTWLKGRNDKFKDLILITVPETLGKGDYDYGIRTSSKCVDPRINVVN